MRRSSRSVCAGCRARRSAGLAAWTRTRALTCTFPTSAGALLSSASFQQPPDASLFIYTALRAASLFTAEHARSPEREDAAALVALAEGLVREWSEGEDLASMGVDEEGWTEGLRKVCGEVCVPLSLLLSLESFTTG